MIERLKYNFWLVVFVLNTFFFLIFLVQAISFTSTYAYRWVFFLSTPFFTSGIHLLIKSRSSKAEWLSIFNFRLTALLIIYFNALPDALESRWEWLIVPIFNQLFINTFDVIWTNNYRFRLLGVISVSILWLTTTFSVLSSFTYFNGWIIPLAIIVTLCILMVFLLGNSKQRA